MTPAPRLLWLVVAVGAFAGLSIWVPQLTVLWRAAAFLLVALALADLLLARRQTWPSVGRGLSRNFPLGSWSTVQLFLHNPSDSAMQLLVHDGHPGSAEVSGLPAELALPARQQAVVSYRLRFRQRGLVEFGQAYLGQRSPLGLWNRMTRAGESERRRVYPDYAEVANFALLGLRNRLGEWGVRRLRRRGEGNEFHQLRDYQSGDSLRQIDWKATARLRRPVSREYQEERDQQVVFLLDCGRRMRHLDAVGAHLDDALNAMLVLAYVAVKQGDAVGFQTFGGERRQFKPRKGANTVPHLLGALYDVRSHLAGSDYLLAARDLMRMQRRRALVILITNSRDEDTPDLVHATRLLRRRHLVLVADLREEELERALHRSVDNLDRALEYHGADLLLEARSAAHERLRHAGVQVMDVLPKQLPVALVNRYLSVKQAGAL